MKTPKSKNQRVRASKQSEPEPIEDPLCWSLVWKGCTVATLAEWLIARYKELPDWKNTKQTVTKDQEVLYTPYQFVVALLQELYVSIQGFAGRVSLESGTLPRPTNPHPRSTALSLPLRAIAYLSWEKESRLFLIRRVFPTYCDFLAISHIPEGWGASSLMLEKLRTNDFAEDTDFVVVDTDDENTLAYTLPYIQEKKRLLYRYVIPVPVFRPGEIKDDSELYGALLLFLGEGSDFPLPETPEGRNFRGFMKELCRSMAIIIEFHNQKLGFPGDLSRYWKDLRAAGGSNVVLAKIKLQGSEGDVEQTARDLLRELSGPNYFALRTEEVSSSSEAPTANVLVAQSKLKVDKLRETILRIVVEKFSSRSVAFEVTVEDAEEGLDSKFCLTNCVQR